MRLRGRRAPAGFRRREQGAGWEGAESERHFGIARELRPYGGGDRNGHGQMERGGRGGGGEGLDLMSSDQTMRPPAHPRRHVRAAAREERRLIGACRPGLGGWARRGHEVFVCVCVCVCVCAFSGMTFGWELFGARVV